MNHPKQHKTLWTVLHRGGGYVRFATREEANIEALNYGGYCVIAPLYY